MSEIRPISFTPRLVEMTEPPHPICLTEAILLAFHQACAQKDVPVATQLMGVLDRMWLRDPDAPWGRRSNVNYLIAARDRFRHLVLTTQAQPEPMASTAA